MDFEPTCTYADQAKYEIGARFLAPIRRLEPCPTQPMFRQDRIDWLVEHWGELGLDGPGPSDDRLGLSALKIYRRDNRWYIRNGQHRWYAAARLGLRELPVLVVEGPSRRWEAGTGHDGRPVLHWFRDRPQPDGFPSDWRWL